jgi:hypothetical protein
MIDSRPYIRARTDTANVVGIADERADVRIRILHTQTQQQQQVCKSE